MSSLNSFQKYPLFEKLFFLLFGLSLLTNLAMAQAAPLNAATQAEISHLLAYMGNSGCEFNRNGTWYDSKAAQAHLEKKNAYLQKRGLIGGAQDFIVRTATSSSMSGKTYLVRCPNGKAVTSASWLSLELQRFRETQNK